MLSISSDQDKIQGLTSGAGDYVTKPFNPAKVLRGQIHLASLIPTRRKWQSQIKMTL